MTERYSGLFEPCGCGGWIKGHPYDPQPHYIELTIRQASRLLKEAKKPPKKLKEPEIIYLSEIEPN